MTALVVRADAAHLPLPDNSVDLVCTSPPYFALRAYTDGGETYSGQIGSEATPQEFLEALWTCTREWQRVVKPTGSIFVNLGDKYAGGGGTWAGAAPGDLYARSGQVGTGGKTYGMRPKSLLGLPWRYALGCIDQLGLILRAEIIWAKPNGLPESVTDRVRRSHEQWFHLTMQPRYFAAVDEIREPQKRTGVRLPGTKGIGSGEYAGGTYSGMTEFYYNPLGKLPGSVWEVPTEPLTVPEHLGVDHFAAFPSEFPRRIILGWSPSGICVECGQPRRPVTEKVRTNGVRGVVTGPAFQPKQRTETADGRRHEFQTEATITGYACACPTPHAPTRRSVILDPFGGTGTTAGVASALGRIGISVDLSHDYSRLARWRVNDPGLRAKALGVAKPPPMDPDQGDLFGDLTGP